MRSCRARASGGARPNTGMGTRRSASRPTWTAGLPKRADLRRDPMPLDTIINAMTIDVEDYFQVSAFAPYIARSEWAQRECRVERNVDRLLEILAADEPKAPSFARGWTAQRYPERVRRTVRKGHELASHGYGHQRASDLTEAEFLQ